jgi:hypothetical protein
MANYQMGLKLGGVSIPDPSGWSFSIEDVDASAERDTTGLLHRDRVAQKINFSYTFNAITWAEVATILNAINSAQFAATTPNPYAAGSTRSGTYYVGKRSGETIFFREDKEETGRFTLSFNIIEY